jgi:NitT/TauT family transport system substrate-binding protein
VRRYAIARSALALGLLLLALVFVANPAAAEKLTLLLNWYPTADHSPYYFARAQGLYSKAGLDITIETGKGSGVAAQRVGAGNVELGVADMATALVARSKGANLVAVMNVYTNSPQGFYWLKSSGIAGPKDFPGHRVGNPPGDAARVMWPAFAKAVGIDASSVTYVNIAPTAKIAALKSGAVDIISDFYNEHDLKVTEFGADLGFLPWRDVGINPYGNSVIVNGDALSAHREAIKTFVAVTQQAFAACAKNEEPCLDALFAEVSGLDRVTQHNQWQRVKELMRDKTTTTIALGWFDPQRLVSDYDLVKTYIGIEQPFEIKTAFTNEFLDQAIKMPSQ